jgi:hypothetical protein
VLRYPASAPFQQSILAPLDALVSRVPACELWIAFVGQVDALFPSLSTGALQTVAQVASVMANVFDNLYATSTQSIYSSQYLMNLSLSAQGVASHAQLSAQLATGMVGVSVTQAAQTALATLLAWNPALGYQTPPNVAQVATTLMSGVTVA